MHAARAKRDDDDDESKRVDSVSKTVYPPPDLNAVCDGEPRFDRLDLASSRSAHDLNDLVLVRQQDGAGEHSPRRGGGQVCELRRPVPLGNLHAVAAQDRMPSVPVDRERLHTRHVEAVRRGHHVEYGRACGRAVQIEHRRANGPAHAVSGGRDAVGVLAEDQAEGVERACGVHEHREHLAADVQPRACRQAIVRAVAVQVGAVPQRPRRCRGLRQHVPPRRPIDIPAHRLAICGPRRGEGRVLVHPAQPRRDPDPILVVGEGVADHAIEVPAPGAEHADEHQAGSILPTRRHTPSSTLRSEQPASCSASARVSLAG